MSWIISKALMEAFENSRFSPGQEAESLGENSLAGEPSAPSNGSPTPQAFLSPDKMTAFSRLSRFGITFAPLTENRGEDLLTWFRAGFLAKTSVQPDEAQESTVNALECGWKWPESSVKFDPATSSWKTRQCSLLEGLDEFLETWPRWGMMRDGECWELATLERPTSENESGSWPTPRSCSAMAATITPESAHAPNRFPNLETIVGRRQWPTPQASDNRDRGNLGSGAIQRRKEKGKHIALSQSVSETSGALNPQWVEWLMAWPLEWTDLKPLGTGRFQAWLRSHGESLGADENQGVTPAEK